MKNQILIKYPTREKFLIACNPDTANSVFSDLKTPESCYRRETMKLSEITTAYDKTTCIALISAWLVNLNEYLNFGDRGMTQIREIAQMIYDDFYYLNLAELNLIFRRIKKGYYGELYGGINGQKVLSYFREFQQERMAMIINLENAKSIGIPTLSELLKARTERIIQLKKI